MKRYINKWGQSLAVVSSVVLILASCNKDLPEAVPITTPPPSGSSIAETIAGDANFSLLKFALNRAGLTSLLADKSAVFTFFAPDNAAFQRSGFADTTAVKALSAAQWNAIIKYNLIGGQKYTSAITTSAPSQNLYLQSNLVIAPPSATLPPGLRMPIFPGKQGTAFFVNNIPVAEADIAVANGVIHKPFAIVAPPAAVLKTAISAAPDLTYYNAAIARADSGQPAGLTRFDSLLNYAPLNMTVLAPNDAAFKTLIYGLAFGKVLAAGGDSATANMVAMGAVAAGPAFLSTNNVSTAQMRGIMAYHFLASNPKGVYEPNFRAFSVNFNSSSTPAFVKTLVNSSVAVHPGILAQATFSGPMVSSLTFSSYGSFPPGGAPFSYTANTVGMDKHAVNGVFHIIDKVLLPQ